MKDVFIPRAHIRVKTCIKQGGQETGDVSLGGPATVHHIQITNRTSLLRQLEMHAELPDGTSFCEFLNTPPHTWKATVTRLGTNPISWNCGIKLKVDGETRVHCAKLRWRDFWQGPWEQSNATDQFPLELELKINP